MLSFRAHSLSLTLRESWLSTIGAQSYLQLPGINKPIYLKPVYPGVVI